VRLTVCLCVCVLCAATAVMAVANIVKTSLGPVGLDKVR
jgi:chaperonin GroEL (HSP60 family)